LVVGVGGRGRVLRAPSFEMVDILLFFEKDYTILRVLAWLVWSVGGRRPRQKGEKKDSFFTLAQTATRSAPCSAAPPRPTRAGGTAARGRLPAPARATRHYHCCCCSPWRGHRQSRRRLLAPPPLHRCLLLSEPTPTLASPLPTLQRLAPILQPPTHQHARAPPRRGTERSPAASPAARAMPPMLARRASPALAVQSCCGVVGRRSLLLPS